MLLTTPRIVPRMTAGLQQSIALLSLSSTAVLIRVALASVDNPALLIVPADGTQGSRPLFESDSIAAPADSLVGHILRQIGLLRLSPRDRVLALALTEALEPTGWLGPDLAHLARDCDVPLAEMEAVLHRLQTLEPSGVFARSLAECLRLQAVDAGLATEAVLAVLDRLPMLAAGDMAGLADAAGLSEEAVSKAARQIRTLNPKPGLAFPGPMPPSFPPDLVAIRTAAGWTVEPHAALPKLVIRQGTGDVRTARLWHQAVARRAALGRQIALLVLDRQRAHLEGTGDLRALTSAELAEAVGAHVATVNRVLKGTTIATPVGTGPLRNWMARPLQPGSGSSVSSVKHSLARLLQDPETALLSDAKLSKLLAEDGVKIARRTVAKYRGEMAVPLRETHPLVTS